MLVIMKPVTKGDNCKLLFASNISLVLCNAKQATLPFIGGRS